MKRATIILVLFSAFLFPRSTYPVAQTDYCVVPPYVLQNIAPNVMLLLDNSHSMLEFAHYDGFVTTTAIANTSDMSQVQVDDVTGFQVGDRIAIYTNQNYWEGWPTNWDLTITAIDTATKTLTVDYEVVNTSNNISLSWLTYGAGAPVILRSRGTEDYSYYLPYYAGAVNGFATTTAAAGTDDGTGGGADSHQFTVVSADGFNAGDRIAIYTYPNHPYWEGGYSTTGYCFGGLQMTITSIDKPNKKITVSYSDDEYLDYPAGAPIILIQAVGATDLSNHVPTCSGDTYVRGTPANSVWDNSFDPSTTYYGYFDTDYWYRDTGTGVNGQFERADSKAVDPTRDAGEWDPSFLNWLTMRRIDVVRRALTGGNPSGSAGQDKLLGSELADCDQRGRSYVGGTANLSIRAFQGSVENYIPSTVATGTRCFRVNTAARGTCDGGGSGTASFNISTDATCSAYTASPNQSYQVKVRQPQPVEGVLQTVVGARARVGLSFFETATDGANVRVSAGDGSLSSTVNEINGTRPNAATTPLGEALWTMTGYFAQDAEFASIGAPGPKYGSNYTINDQNDPYYYGHGRYPECATSHVLLLTDGEPCGDGNLPATILDYASGTGEFNCTGGTCPGITNTTGDNNYTFSAETLPGLPACALGNVAGVEDVALWMHTTDLRDTALVDAAHNINGEQVLNLFVVHAFGQSSTLLKYAAINGGYEEGDGIAGPSKQDEWDADEDGNPDTFYEAGSSDLETQISNAFNRLLKRASSGTAASVLASGEGSGANLVQAVFYPRRAFGSDILFWTGTLHNFWYYVDPYFSYSSIREDTSPADQVLDLQTDKVAELFFDEEMGAARAYMYIDSDGDGAKDYPEDVGGDGAYLHDLDGNGINETDSKAIEDVEPIWEAGQKLLERDLSTSPRTIYTNLYDPTDGSFYSFVNSAANAAILNSYLGVTDTDASGSTVDEAQDVINWIHGYQVDQVAGFRSTLVNSSGTISTWKLGDVLNSTPKIISRLPINAYYDNYGDATYGSEDAGGFVGGTLYQNRGMVFAGGNDGMLHAFKMGTLEDDWGQTDPSQRARITNTTDIGKEMWGFIPKNALPYLKWIGDQDYCHIYTVDLSPFVFDASVNKPVGCAGDYWNCTKTAESWRTVLIGGMRFGGACKAFGSASGVAAPVQVDGEDIGYSSYFALDVTDPTDPEFMWEFTNADLGFSTTGPAIVKLNGTIAGVESTDANGRWYAVFGSGPTGPIYTPENQFLGQSDQSLRFFVVDVATGALVKTIGPATPAIMPNAISNAFAGSMINVVNDPDVNYEDDVFYVGYTARDTCPNPCTWTKGGVLRVQTNGDIDVNNWRAYKVIQNIGPVTSSVQTLQDNINDNLWLYFGTGRYYYAVSTYDPKQDDLETQRYIYGVNDPCYSSEDSSPVFAACDDSKAISDLTFLDDATEVENATGDVDSNSDGEVEGWKVALDPMPANPTTCTETPPGEEGYVAATYDPLCGFGAERVITDPVTSLQGIAYVTSYKPYNKECGLGGKSYLWALDYESGGDPGARLKGTALIQVSTGAIEKVDLAEMFEDKGGRRSSSMEGVPPTAQGFSLFLTPPPDERVIHVQEK